MTRRELDYSDELRDLRDRRAKELELDPTIIAAKGTLLALARTDSTEWERLLPWQLEILQPGRRTP